MISKEIILLTDYKGMFGSKYDAIPYNSGMDKNCLKNCFLDYNINVNFLNFSEVSKYSHNYWKDKIILYTSSEDTGHYYKSFIEDIVLYIEQNGGIVLPNYNFLRANNNKVYMELLRKSLFLDNNSSTSVYGCMEELIPDIDKFNYPLVYKLAKGALSRGVGMVENKKVIKKVIKKASRSKFLFKELWEIGRKIKHKGYIPQSKYRKKFIIQQFIKNLDGDYKVLVFGSKYYIIKRSPKKDDFRASGSGIKQFTKNIPDGLLFFAKDVFKKLNVPNASLDIAYDGKNYHLIEFQCIYFGSYTLTYSPFHWDYNIEENQFKIIEMHSKIEVEYAKSIYEFLRKNYLLN